MRTKLRANLRAPPVPGLLQSGSNNPCCGLVLIPALQRPFCLRVDISLSGFSRTLTSVINQLIGQHAWKGQLSVSVRSSREALWQMSCLCGLSDWSASLSPHPPLCNTSPFSFPITACFLSRCVPAAERRALHHDAAGGDAAWHRRGDEVPVGHELRAPRPGRPQHPGQQQPGLQGFRLRAVPLPGRHVSWRHLHQLPGEGCVFARSL